MCIFRESIYEKMDNMNINELWDELERALHNNIKHTPQKRKSTTKSKVSHT